LKFEAMPAESERLFVRLIMKADDFGRFHADPRLVRAACYPLEDCSTAKVQAGLQDLIKRGLLFAYEVESRPYMAIVNYGQRLKQSRPKFPQPDGESDDWKPTSGNFRELPARSVSRREVEEEENTKAAAPLAYGELLNVKLTDEEHAKLKLAYGQALDDAIDILDAYIASKGKKYKSHYAVMKRGGWVWDKVNEKCGVAAPHNAGGYKDDDGQMAAIEALTAKAKARQAAEGK